MCAKTKTFITRERFKWLCESIFGFFSEEWVEKNYALYLGSPEAFFNKFPAAGENRIIFTP